MNEWQHSGRRMRMRLTSGDVDDTNIAAFQLTTGTIDADRLYVF